MPASTHVVSTVPHVGPSRLQRRCACAGVRRRLGCSSYSRMIRCSSGCGRDRAEAILALRCKPIHTSAARAPRQITDASMSLWKALSRAPESNLTARSITISPMRWHRLRRLFLPGTALLLSYVSLFVIHLRNSLPSLAADLVPPDLGYSAAANPTLQV